MYLSDTMMCSLFKLSFTLQLKPTDAEFGRKDEKGQAQYVHL